MILEHRIETSQKYRDISNNLPNYNYYLDSKLLILAGVALAAIGLVGVSFSIISFSIFTPLWIIPIAFSPLIFGGAGGLVALAFQVYRTRIAKEEFIFAESQPDADSKLKYYSKAAQNGYVLAIQREYNIGKNLILQSCVNENTKESDLMYKKGLGIINQSIFHSIGKCHTRTKQWLREHPELTNQLRSEINSDTNKISTRLIGDVIDRYTIDIMKKTASYVFWRPEKF